MANYSREDAEKQGNAEVGVGVALVTGLAALVAGGVMNSAKKSKQKDEIDQRIQEIDREINDYNSGWFRRKLYEDEINQLEREREKLKKDRETL